MCVDMQWSCWIDCCHSNYYYWNACYIQMYEEHVCDFNDFDKMLKKCSEQIGGIEINKRLFLF